jgi:hypothetical protein
LPARRRARGVGNFHPFGRWQRRAALGRSAVVSGSRVDRHATLADGLHQSELFGRQVDGG